MGHIEGRIHEFYTDAMTELNARTLINEQEAKLAALVAMAAGLNVVFFGSPGGGKTTLGEHLPLLVEGLDGDRIAAIPPEPDLTPKELVGGRVELEKDVTDAAGNTTHEVVGSNVQPIIKPSSLVIWANEINRGNSHTLNTSLEAFESGTLDTTAGRTNLDLLWIASTMNPGEKKQGTMEVSVAMASRHAIGAVMGNGPEAEQDQIHDAIDDGWLPQPDQIKTVTSVEELRAFQALLRTGGTILNGDVKPLSRALVKKTKAVLAANGIYESIPRLSKHNRLAAMTIAALEGKTAVREEDVIRSIRLVAGAQAGMLQRDSRKATEIVDEIVAAV